MPEQLTFDLPVRCVLGREDFFVSAANGAAVATIAKWPDWPEGKMVLCGPKGAGKTHLVHVWAAQASAQIVAAKDLHSDNVADLVAISSRVAVEDVDQIAGQQAPEKALFHLHNLALADGGRILLTGQTPPANWPLLLADLKSRLLGAGLTQLSAPDDSLIAAVLVKLFGDRQLEVSPDVIRYLVRHMERSFDAAGAVVAALDALALSEGRAISRNLAARVLDKNPQGGP